MLDIHKGNKYTTFVITLWCELMPEEITKDPSEDFSEEDLEDRVERDLENFKSAVSQYFSE